MATSIDDKLLAKLEEIESARTEIPGRCRSLDSQQTEHQVLRVDTRMAHALRLVDGKGESLLALLGQRKIGRRADPLQNHAISQQLLTELSRIDASLLEKPVEGRIGFTQHPEEDMLSRD